jgi:hypothetical protein
MVYHKDAILRYCINLQSIRPVHVNQLCLCICMYVLLMEANSAVLNTVCHICIVDLLLDENLDNDMLVL